MITGYNHNVLHRNIVYHIQTEDSGIKYPHIITHLFIGGNIISSKKRSYAHLLEKNLSPEELEKAVRELMKEQHKEMLLELKAGKYDHLKPPGDSEEKDIITDTPEEQLPPPKPIEPQPPTISPPPPFDTSKSQQTLPTTPLPKPHHPTPNTHPPTLQRKKPRRTVRRAITRNRPQFKAPTPTEIDVVKAIKSSSPPKDTNDDMESPTIPEIPQLLALFEKGHFESNISEPPSHGKSRFSQLRKEKFRRHQSGAKRPILELKPKRKK